MLALCLMLLLAYYAQKYANIIDWLKPNKQYRTRFLSCSFKNIYCITYFVTSYYLCMTALLRYLEMHLLHICMVGFCLNRFTEGLYLDSLQRHMKKFN